MGKYYIIGPFNTILVSKLTKYMLYTSCGFVVYFVGGNKFNGSGFSKDPVKFYSYQVNYTFYDRLDW